MVPIKFHLLLCCFMVAESIDVSKPINASEYKKIVKYGFATNYFKSTKPLTKKYQDKNIDDVAAKGFSNLRLRCRTDFAEGLNMTVFLTDLETVVDKCLATNIFPIISWINHYAEAFGTEKHRQDYIDWWTTVATRLKDKNFRLSFNLFTELGVDTCQATTCNESLRENPDKYNNWTKSVTEAIRQTGGNNNKRILILGSPQKTARSLPLINKTIYENDNYMMAEWHIYASGPNKKIFYKDDGSFKKYSIKYWNNTGDTIGKMNVKKQIKEATDYIDGGGLDTYNGAWLPLDNEFGVVNEEELINFSRYFIKRMKKISHPWTMNVLDRFYDTTNSQWLTGIQTMKTKKGTYQNRSMENILAAIVDELGI